MIQKWEFNDPKIRIGIEECKEKKTIAHLTKKVKKEAEEVLKDNLSNYRPEKYPKPSVTVDMVICTILDGVLKVLLIRRKFPPHRDRWAIPGGFLDLNKKETLEKAAARELKEETGLENIFIEQLKTYGDPDRDPRMRVITVAYYALIPYSEVAVLEAGDDTKEADWFALNKGERQRPTKLAFDHEKILFEAMLRIRGKVTYTPIAFRLIPDKFTWPELQRVYEIILGRKLLAPNFRRKIRSMYDIIGLKEKRKNGIGRPKELLKYNGLKGTL